jgi:ATP-binding cassette, subfamily C, bacterial LapB
MKQSEGAFSKPDIFRPDGFRLAALSLLLSTLAINILSLALPVMTLQVYDRILPNPDSGTLPVLIFGVCIAVLLESILRLSRSYMIGWAGAAFEHRLSCKALKRVLEANPLYLNAHGVGEHLHRMAAISKLKDFYDGYTLITYAELVFVPLFFGLIVYIAGMIALVPAAILAVFTLVSLWKGRKLRQSLKERDRADDGRFNFLIESLEGIHTLKAFALEKFFERRYEALEERSSLANYKVSRETASIFDMGTIFSHVMVAGVISVGAFLVLQNYLTTGALIATLLLSGRMLQPVQRALVLWAKYQNYTLARDKLEKLFTMPICAPVKKHREPAREGRIETKGLHFRYRRSEPWLFENVDFGIKSGEVVLISGAHGSGKTSLLKLIAGIYPVAKGRIEVDGLDIAAYPASSLSRHVGYMRTEGLIFRGTIRDNLTCFGQVDEKSAREAAALLKVDRDVSKLPSGFDTFLGGNSTDSIPPGLKQRIAMACVLALKPQIILFDNADRGLDNEGYSLVYSMLAGLKGKSSLILVADDPNLRHLADRALRLEKGVLVDAPECKRPGNVESYRELRA